MVSIRHGAGGGCGLLPSGGGGGVLEFEGLGDGGGGGGGGLLPLGGGGGLLPSGGGGGLLPFGVGGGGGDGSGPVVEVMTFGVVVVERTPVVIARITTSSKAAPCFMLLFLDLKQ